MMPARLVVASVVLLCASSFGQMLTQQELLNPQKTASWPTYNGDYSGRRHTPLNAITPKTLPELSIAWMYRIPTVGSLRGVGSPEIKSTPLMVNGILYFTIPDHVYAVNARTGEELWHYDWQDEGGHLVGNRGVGMYGDWLFFLTPDDWLISLEAKSGKERWRKKIADEKLQYFTTAAPLVIRNHIVVGVGGDAMDMPGFLECRDPETGAVQWRWNTEPAENEPEAQTWPNGAARTHGGGMTWLTGTYDPELNLLYWGTGNPNPVYAGQGRKGSNLWTCSIVALDADSGKLRWYFQASPHDTHDWDNVETPILFSATIDGKPRKLLAQAARNGYFFVLDRMNGSAVVSKPYVAENWSTGTDSQGRPVPNEKKEPTVDGSLVSMAGGGATNWMPPSVDEKAGLFFVNATNGYSLAYLTDTDERPEGYGGSGRTLWSEHLLEAMDLRTGNIVWRHTYRGTERTTGLGGPGILTTDSGLLFTGDYAGNFIAYDSAHGKPIWHYALPANVSNGPESFLLDGNQYLVVGAGDTLFGFSLTPAASPRQVTQSGPASPVQ